MIRAEDAADGLAEPVGGFSAWTEEDIDEHGTLVPGRSAQERVRNPSLMGLAQARTDMIRLAKAIPLVDPKPRQDGIEVDRFLEEIMR